MVTLGVFYSLNPSLCIALQSTDPAVIQTHLKKLFAGIHSVGFNETKKAVLNMRSQV